MDQDRLIRGLNAALGDDLGQAVWKFLTVDERGWAQAGWQRVDRARAEGCH